MSDKINPDYYKSKIETADYIDAHEMDYFQGNEVKYITRFKKKNGLEDLKKAQWYLQRLIKKYENNDDSC